jgi:hypothetical protein
MTRFVRFRPRTEPVTLVLVMLCSVFSAAAHAWSLQLAPASRRVFLHVGNGTMNGNNGTVNLVQVTVPALQVGNGSAQAMTSNSSQSRTLYGDNVIVCPDPTNQVMIGASYRRSNFRDGPASATLRVSSPANLTNGNGETIPISQISWTVSAPGSTLPDVISAGTFNGSTQTLATVPANRYIENCHTFSYANSAIRAAGTYNARVTYTLSSP